MNGQKRLPEQKNVNPREDRLVVHNLAMTGLVVDHWAAELGQSWCLVGTNRSGINHFISLFSHSEEINDQALILIPGNMEIVSFQVQQELFEKEIALDDSDYLDRPDPGTIARTFLGGEPAAIELVQLFQLEHVLDQGYRQLSSGESRKLLLLSALTRGARWLVLEHPYDGLDILSCAEFDRIMKSLTSKNIGVIVSVGSPDDVPDWCTHLAYFDRGRLCDQGLRIEVLRRIPRKDEVGQWFAAGLNEEHRRQHTGETLVALRKGRASYGGQAVFAGLDLTIHAGEHTLITGTNGSGKSTLLALLTGDHHDCYTNELQLLGIKRGSGESIWQLKRDMGIVSPALHRRHYIPGNALHIVVSGFFDSIGLYKRASVAQQKEARQWLQRLELGDRENVAFRRLSYAEQRLVLIARALIKWPRLLVLDEPTQGLDYENRKKLLDFLELVAREGVSTIIYVSHRQDEYRTFFRQQIDMDTYSVKR